MDFLPVGFILVLACISTAQAILCYQCNFLDPGCDKLRFNDTNSQFFKECSSSLHGNATFCRKTTVKVLDPDLPMRMFRACGYIAYKGEVPNCYENDSAFKQETTCQCFADGCNGATGMTRSTTHWAMVTVLPLCALLVARFRTRDAVVEHRLY